MTLTLTLSLLPPLRRLLVLLPQLSVVGKNLLLNLLLLLLLLQKSGQGLLLLLLLLNKLSVHKLLQQGVLGLLLCILLLSVLLRELHESLEVTFLLTRGQAPRHR